jgi:hypothetical protein
MDTRQTSPTTLAALASMATDLNTALLTSLDTAPGSYDDACQLVATLRALRASIALAEGRRAALWRGHQDALMEDRRRQRTAERERTRLAEMEADRIGAPYAVRR